MLPDEALRRDADAVMQRVSELAGLEPRPALRRRGCAGSGANASAADCAAPVGRWPAVTPELLDAVIASEYGAFERTGWQLHGDYEPMPPAQRAQLAAIFAPFDRALELLLGCRFYAQSSSPAA